MAKRKAISNLRRQQKKLSDPDVSLTDDNWLNQTKDYLEQYIPNSNLIQKIYNFHPIRIPSDGIEFNVRGKDGKTRRAETAQQIHSYLEEVIEYISNTGLPARPNILATMGKGELITIVIFILGLIYGAFELGRTYPKISDIPSSGIPNQNPTNQAYDTTSKKHKNSN